MEMPRMKRLAAPLLTALLSLAPALRADEGMWTFDNLPMKLLKEKYGFSPSGEWLDHVRLSSLTMGGCSASFISADGLVMTNHHCGRGIVGAVADGRGDLLRDGFVAMAREEEIKVDMPLRVLQKMQNVTNAVNAAAKPGMDARAAEDAKDAALAEAVEAMKKSTDLDCRAVRLYHGGEYWVYGYEVFDDVRLVAAPEMQLAGFGGDFDNFTYPRHNLDFMLFRVYRDGRPYSPPHFLRWSSEGLKDGDITFVIGHPGSTMRGLTYGQMLYARDVTGPTAIRAAELNRAALLEFGALSPENRRMARTQLLSVENGLKANRGYHAGLLDAAAMAEVLAKEGELRAKVAKDPKLKVLAGDSWNAIDRALKTAGKDAPMAGLASRVPTRLMAQLRSAVAQIETGKATETQWRGMLSLNDPALDLILMESWLKELSAKGQGDGPLAATALNGMVPREAAKSILASPFADEAARKSLIDGGKDALETCGDHAIRLARLIWATLESIRERQAGAEAAIKDHAARIAKARFDVYGKDTYPDATGTLRMTFGPVSAFEASGTLVQPFTTFGGMYDRHAGWGGNGANAHGGAWALPQRWLDKREAIDPDTPLNFSHSIDIIGGNSGSPVINAEAEVVGLVFDGNITMLPGRYYYRERDNRSVSVDARAIIEALGKVMGAGHIVEEISGRRQPAAERGGP
jgi:V8-like Glu-specific endopeptidase